MIFYNTDLQGKNIISEISLVFWCLFGCAVVPPRSNNPCGLLSLTESVAGGHLVTDPVALPPALGDQLLCSRGLRGAVVPAGPRLAPEVFLPPAGA